MKLALRAQSPSIRRVETVEAPADASIALAILAFLGEPAPPRTPFGASAVRPRAVGAEPAFGAPPATASGPRGDRRPSLPGLTGSPSTRAKNASGAGAGGADPIPSGHRAARATAAYGRPTGLDAAGRVSGAVDPASASLATPPREQAPRALHLLGAQGEDGVLAAAPRANHSSVPGEPSVCARPRTTDVPEFAPLLTAVPRSTEEPSAAQPRASAPDLADDTTRPTPETARADAPRIATLETRSRPLEPAAAVPAARPVSAALPFLDSAAAASRAPTAANDSGHRAPAPAEALGVASKEDSAGPPARTSDRPASERPRFARSHGSDEAGAPREPVDPSLALGSEAPETVLGAVAPIGPPEAMVAAGRLAADVAAPSPDLAPARESDAGSDDARQARATAHAEAAFAGSKGDAGSAAARISVEHPTLGPLTVEVRQPSAGVDVEVATNAFGSALAIKGAEESLRRELRDGGTELRSLRVRVRRARASDEAAPAADLTIGGRRA